MYELYSAFIIAILVWCAPLYKLIKKKEVLTFSNGWYIALDMLIFIMIDNGDKSLLALFLYIIHIICGLIVFIFNEKLKVTERDE